MPESRTLTGHTVAMVKLAEGGEAIVRRGETLPEGMADGELARLEKIGAFNEPAVADLRGQGARVAVVAAPEVVRNDPELPGRGDFGAPLLSPQLTLAANPEPEGEPVYAQVVAEDQGVPLLNAGELGQAPTPAKPRRQPKNPPGE